MRREVLRRNFANAFFIVHDQNRFASTGFFAGIFFLAGLRIWFLHRGQKDFKCRADANCRVNPDPAVALFYDAVNRREA